MSVARSAVDAALARVPDPCMDLAGARTSIVELGLVRGVAVGPDGSVDVTVTFTEVGCAYTHAVLDRVHEEVGAVPGVTAVRTTIAWAPTWSPDDLMAPARQALAAAKARLGRPADDRGVSPTPAPRRAL